MEGLRQGMDRLKGVNTVSNNSKGNNMDKGSRGKGSNNSRHQVDNLEDLLKVMGKVLDNLEAALLLALDNNRAHPKVWDKDKSCPIVVPQALKEK